MQVCELLLHPGVRYQLHPFPKTGSLAAPLQSLLSEQPLPRWNFTVSPVPGPTNPRSYTRAALYQPYVSTGAARDSRARLCHDHLLTPRRFTNGRLNWQRTFF